MAFAQSGPPVPTTPQVPQAAKHGRVNFFGKWTLAFYNGSRVNVGGSTMSLPYSEMHVTFSGGQVNSDGATSFFGAVDNEDGSSVTAYYNPNIDKQYVQVFVYVPDMEFGLSNQYTQTECRVFIAPKGNDYLHGTMSAIQQSADRNGNWVTKSLFDGQVDIHRPMPPTPVVGGKG